MKKISTAAPIIVMSGGGVMPVENILKIARQLGAHRVLKKPFASAALLAAVATALASKAAPASASENPIRLAT